MKLTVAAVRRLALAGMAVLASVHFVSMFGVARLHAEDSAISLVQAAAPPAPGPGDIAIQPRPIATQPLIR